MKYCNECSFAKKIIEERKQKLQCINKESRFYGKTFGLNAHSC